MQTLPAKSAFKENLSSIFVIRGPGGDLAELELIDLKEGNSNPRLEQFSLTFKGPQVSILPQQIYTLQHTRLGELDLFLVPIGRDAGGTYYEAVFSQLLSS